MTDAAVRFEAVVKDYGEFRAISALDLEIAPGELVSLLGPSGCGKTSTLRMIAGLEMPTDGRISIGGRDVSRVPANKRSIGMVFQSYALFPHMNIRENVAYGLLAEGKKKSEARERAQRQLEQLGLDGMGDRLPSELSGGQQQRAALARALVLEPDVLLFDEPLSNLDAKLRRQVRDEIRDLQQKLKLSVVYVTHDQTEALAISDRIILMREGRIAQAGSPRELYDTPQSEFVADFMGDANVIRLTAGENGAVSLGTFTLKAEAGAAVAVVARPEHLRIAHGEGPGFPGRILRASYLGALTEYRVETDYGTLLVIDRDVTTPAAAGQAIRLDIDPNRLRLIAAGK